MHEEHEDGMPIYKIEVIFETPNEGEVIVEKYARGTVDPHCGVAAMGGSLIAQAYRRYGPEKPRPKTSWMFGTPVNYQACINFLCSSFVEMREMTSLEARVEADAIMLELLEDEAKFRQEEEDFLVAELSKEIETGVLSGNTEH